MSSEIQTSLFADDSVVDLPKYQKGQRVRCREWLGALTGRPMIIESVYRQYEGGPFAYVLNEVPGDPQCRAVGFGEDYLFLEGYRSIESEITNADAIESNRKSAFLALGHWADQKTANARSSWQRARANWQSAQSHLETLKKEAA